MSTIFVASKLPNDFLAQVYAPERYLEEGLHGVSERTRMVATGRSVVIRGVGYPINPASDFLRVRRPPDMVGDFALTIVSDGDTFAAWWRQNFNEAEPNKSWPPIAGNFVVWGDDLAALKKRILDGEPKLTGFEPLAPGADPRVARPVTSLMSVPVPADKE